MAETFRPNDLSQIYGQDHLLPMLADWSEDPGKIPNCLMLTGPYGCGKTTIASILASRLTNCQSDIMDINAASSRGIDDARGWAEAARVRPFGKARVFIFDELHQMTKDAQSSLLKVFEKHPPSTYFFLCTTDGGKLLPALRSRCTPLEVKLFDLASTQSLLQSLYPGVITNDVAEKIHLRTGGHARDAVKVADVIKGVGHYDETALDQTFGISFNQATKIFFEYVANPKAEPYRRTVKALESLDRGAGELIDGWVDSLVYQNHPQVTVKLSELYQIRALRRRYEITPREALMHLLTVLYLP